MSANSKVNVVIMGDSNTEGYGLASPKDSYPYKLNVLLGKNGAVQNFGVSGTCVINTKDNGRQVGMPYVLEKAYKDALAANGDIFIVNLGTNDAQDGMDDTLPVADEYSNLIKYHARFKDDYSVIIDDIKKYHPSAKIFICIPIPVRQCIWRKHQEIYLQTIISYFQEILDKYDEVKCIDLHSEFLKLGSAYIDSMYLEDGLHLNEKGTDYVAAAIKRFVEEEIQ